MKSQIRIATRKSELAVWQSNWVAKKLNQLELSSKLIECSTKGDEDLSQSLAKIGGKGLFIKELELAMLENQADIAVHSMKDVPAQLPQSFTFPAYLKRENPADCLIVKKDQASEWLKDSINHFQLAKKKINADFLSKLPKAFSLGTSSLRRSSQLLRANRSLSVLPVRGNLNTRIKKLQQGQFDGLVLARAGINRLVTGSDNPLFTDFDDHFLVLDFSKKTMLPAINQGVIGIECRTNSPLIDTLKQLNHPKSAIVVAAERLINQKLGGSCTSTLCAFAQLKKQRIKIVARVLSTDGKECLEVKQSAAIDRWSKIANQIANRLESLGAKQYL